MDVTLHAIRSLSTASSNDCSLFVRIRKTEIRSEKKGKEKLHKFLLLLQTKKMKIKFWKEMKKNFFRKKIWKRERNLQTEKEDKGKNGSENEKMRGKRGAKDDDDGRVMSSTTTSTTMEAEEEEVGSVMFVTVASSKTSHSFTLSFSFSLSSVPLLSPS